MIDPLISDLSGQLVVNTGFAMLSMEANHMDDLNADVSALLWEQAKRQLADQSASLDSLRTRATGILSVATLVAGLFATRLPAHTNSLHGRQLVWIIAALTLFAVSAALAIAVAAPRKDWNFAFDLSDLLSEVRRFDAMPVDVTANLAQAAAEAYKANAEKIRWLYISFSGVCALVALQVVAWSIAAL